MAHRENDQTSQKPTLDDLFVEMIVWFYGLGFFGLVGCGVYRFLAA